MILSLLTSLSLLLTPATHAEVTTNLSFLKSQVPGDWVFRNAETAKPSPTGLVFHAREKGLLERSLRDIPHKVERIGITYTALEDVHVKLRFHPPEMGLKKRLQSKLTFPKSIVPTTYELPVGEIRGWDSDTDTLGFLFEQPASLTIQNIALTQYSLAEELGAMWTAFWDLNRFWPYTVNFLWGPLIVQDYRALETLYDHLPPKADSGLQLFYLLLGLTGAVALGALVAHKREWISPNARKKAVVLFVGVFIASWLVFDLRMGLEILQYSKHDVLDYYNTPRGERRFRDRGVFYEFTKAVAPLTRGEDRYIFMAKQEYPFLGLMRYFTYPALPTLPTQANDVPLWIVYKRKDIQMNENGELYSGDVILSPPGEMIYEFENGTFIFQSNI